MDDGRPEIFNVRRKGKDPRVRLQGFRGNKLVANKLLKI
jgi:hypothetical protein